MPRPADIEIQDLANPVHTQTAQQIIASLGDAQVDLSVDAVLQAATERTELVELPEDYIARMSLLLECMSEDRDQSPFGRMLNFNNCVGYVVQRCRLEQLYLEHPEINDIEIHQPIIIAGLPRSGTSHMLNLISVDKRLRSLPLWESMEPFPSSEERAAGSDQPRIQRCHDRLAMQETIMPHFKSMHDMHPDHIEEESHLMQMDFATVLLDNYSFSSRWRDDYLASDQTANYQNLKRILKALQWLRSPDLDGKNNGGHPVRWILKSPQHMEQLGPLINTFSDATIVFPHRDPVAVATSMITMMAYSARMSRDPVDPKMIGAYWIDRIERLLAGCVRDYDLLPKSKTVDVVFDQFMADDVGTIERIYKVAEHPMTAEIKQAMANFMLDHPRGKHGRINYRLSEDFAVSKEQLHERFAFYTDRFDVPLEH